MPISSPGSPEDHAVPEAGTVCAVIVTYGDRFALLAQGLQAVLAEGVAEVIVVDNGTPEPSRSALQALAANEPRVTVHRLEHNQGSAPGFRHGLELALQSRHAWVWLLDDDNRPDAGALLALQAFGAETVAPQQRGRVVLSSFRADRPNFVEALAHGRPELVLPPQNAFAGFHIAGLWHKLRERLAPVPKRSTALPRSGRLAACAYGGLYCHRSVLEAGPLPDTRYVLYMDDFAFTRGIVERGGEIWLVRDSVIQDIEASFYLPPRKALLYHSVFDAPRDAAVYYGVRNGVYFAKHHLTTRPWLRQLNKALFLSLILCIGLLRGQGHRLRLLWQAVRDGEAGRLGLHPGHPI
jgi:GT2 family glycosyltransferase